ncbi:MAG: hypothetical protein NPIRA02_20700 [Nitrospirales bacterium]|nr:MAG: hypothetical protein NPIRA02_20700 [Nitrospirales bacterium]
MAKRHLIFTWVSSGSLMMMLSCAVQPNTHYYDLAVQSNFVPGDLNRSIHLGVGPFSFPDVLERAGIVTRSSPVNIKVSNYHVWAGSLEQAFTRVLGESLAHNLSQNDVWAFPWDTRFRPEYQVRGVVSQFSGEAGGTVKLKLQWTLLEDHGKKVVTSYRYQQATTAEDTSYDAYVAALNRLLNTFASDLSKEIAAHLVSDRQP